MESVILLPKQTYHRRKCYKLGCKRLIFPEKYSHLVIRGSEGKGSYYFSNDFFLTGHCHQSSKRPTEDLVSHPRVFEQPAKKCRGIFCVGCFHC